jgi:hypothetical protein
VALPGAAPHLAAPADVDQFRSGESLIVWDHWRQADELHGLGTTRYSIGGLRGSEALEVQFDAHLGGAAVEILAERDFDQYPLLPRTRLHESQLRLTLSPRTEAVTVIVHHHLRAAPAVSSRSGVREEDRHPRGYLYYYDPGGALELCEAPSREPAMSGSLDGGPAKAVALLPTPLTRLLY